MTLARDDRVGRSQPAPPTELTVPGCQSSDVTAGLIAAALPAVLAACAVVHFGMVPIHAGQSTVEGAAFAVVGWTQAVAAALVWRNGPGRWGLRAIVALNAVVVAVWLLSRTVGLPVGTPGPQAIGAADALATALEMGVVVGARRLLRAQAPARWARGVDPTLPFVLFVGLAAVSLTQSAGHAHGTSVGLGHPGAAEAAHDHADEEQAHDHGDPSLTAGADQPVVTCEGLLAASQHHWSSEVADVSSTMGCQASATAAGATGGDPNLDAAPFADRLFSEVGAALGSTGLATCAVPNLSEDLLGSDEGVLFHLAAGWEACNAPSPAPARVAVAAFATRAARDASAAQPSADVTSRWVYGRFVVATLAGTPPAAAKAIAGAITGMGAVPVAAAL